jgi:hypothetical protein
VGLGLDSVNLHAVILTNKPRPKQPVTSDSGHAYQWELGIPAQEPVSIDRVIELAALIQSKRNDFSA